MNPNSTTTTQKPVETATTTQKPAETTTTTVKPVAATTTTVKPEAKPEPQAAPADINADGPTREESLKSAGKASPHAANAGLKDGTKVLGSEGQSPEDRLNDARREGLANAKDERKARV